MNVRFPFDFDEDKNLLLKEIRGVNFEDIVEAIRIGGILDDLEHHDKKKYPGQKVLVVKIKKYIYAVPYVIDKRRKVIFLKTVYPSRALTYKYKKELK